MANHLRAVTVAVLALVVLAAYVAAAPEKKLSKPESDMKRREGDKAMAAREFSEAIKHYTEAIDLYPTNPDNIMKRANAFMIMNKTPAAVGDLTAVINMDGKHVQAYTHRAKLMKAQGKFDEAADDFESLVELDPSDRSNEAQAEECRMWSSKKSHVLGVLGDGALSEESLLQARGVVDEVINVATESIMLRLARSRLSIKLRDYESALADTGHVIKIDSNNIEAYEVRGKAFFYMGDQDMAMKHWQQALRSDPDHDGCREAYKAAKKYGNLVKRADAARDTRKYQDCVDLYRMAIEVDADNRRTNSALYVQRAKCLHSLKKYREAVEDCNKSLEHNGDNVEALTTRAEAKMETEDFEGGVRDYEAAHEKDQGNREVMAGLQNAQKRLKMSKRKDYYKILGVSRDATDREIKKAYRRLAVQWHPDKVTEDMKEEATKKFNDVANAYEILNDPEKKARFDNGEDLEEQGGGGPPRGHPFPGGFPGGFNFQFH